MPTLFTTTMPLADQLIELEDYYAECLTDNEAPVVLMEIWKKIKAIRQQLNEPVYHNATAREFRR